MSLPSRSEPLPLVVLKFGSSLLADVEGFRIAAREVANEVRQGWRVVVVVSARRGVTNGLLDDARTAGGESDDRLVARLLRSGEEASAALLAIALAELGVCPSVLSTDELGLRTRGSITDGEPVDVNVARLRSELADHDAVVVPGFVGRDRGGAPSLLGRGGSDYTALYLAWRLRATAVRLVKDVDGVFPVDPAAGPGFVEPLAAASWGEVCRVGNGVVQAKALRFAERARLDFRVAAIGGQGTRVGRGR